MNLTRLSLITCIVILALPLFSHSQDCVTLPSSGTYTGKTLNHAQFSNPTQLTIDSDDVSSLTLSDVSAGMLSAMGAAPLAVTITFDCDGSPQAIQQATDYGVLHIDGGSIVNGKLTIEWRIPENLIDEKTEITL